MSSHVAFFNFPAIGHLTPSLGLVEELVRRGHRVTSTATDYFAPVVESAGAEAVRYRSEFGEYYTSPFTPEAISGEGLRTLNEATSALEQVEDFYRQNRPDVLVYDFMAWGARFLASKLDIPAVRIYPSYAANEHFSIQEKFPMAEFTDTKVAEMIGQLEELLPSMGMPGMTAMDFFTQQEELGVVLLPREFHYEGDTFDDSFVFAGPCLGDRSSFQGSWNPSSADDPVLLISLGTAATGWPEFFRMCVQSFADTKWNVVMAVGDHIDATDLAPLPGNFEVRRHVPQLDVLTHADLFITHGGMGSTMESLYNGVPMVVIPQMSEQTANAMRVEELGLGKYLSSENTTVDSLRESAAAASEDPSVRDRLRTMRQSMRALDGPRIAADAVEGYLKDAC